MELVALKNLSNGVKAGQTFTERNAKTAEILITIGAARTVDAEQPRVIRRRRRSSRAEAATS